MNTFIKKLFDQAVINKKPLILDGAMGALLSQMGFKWDIQKWMTGVLEKSPEIILDIHKKYIEAGADIITTHTFRTNPVAIGAEQSKLLVKRAIELANQARMNTKALIAGSNPPAEDCYKISRSLSKKELELNHCNHIDLLVDTGVDIILNETQSHLDEIIIICEYCNRNEIPFIVSIFFDNNLNILSGEPVSELVNLILEHNPISIGFNCIHPNTFEKLMDQFELDTNWGFYLNCGAGAITNKKIECGITPLEYRNIIKKYLRKNPCFIGACCGSSPDHIKVIKALINE